MSDITGLGGSTPQVGGSGDITGTQSTGTQSTPSGGTVGDSSSSAGGGTTNTTPNADQPVIVAVNVEGLNFSKLMMLTQSALNDARKQRILEQRDNSLYVIDINSNTVTVNNNNNQQDSNSNSNSVPNGGGVTVTTTSLSVTDQSTNIDNTGIITSNEKKIPVLVPPVFSDSVQSFVDEAAQDSPILVLMPALSLVNEEGTLSGFNEVTPTQADIAAAVAYQEYTMNVVDVGSSKDFAATQFPDDETAAANAAALMDTQLLNRSAVGLGEALEMPGLETQLELQAGLNRDIVNLFNDVGNVDSFIDSLDLAGLSQQAGISSNELKAHIEKAISDAQAQGTYLTADDFFAAVSQNLTEGLNSAEVVQSVGSGLKTQATASALGSNYELSVFDPSQIEIEKSLNTLTMGILSEWGENIDENAARNQAESIVNNVLKSENLNKYKKAEDVRNAISQALVTDLDMDADTANAVAASVDLGLPKTGPLYDANSTVVMSPDDFEASFQEGYTSMLHVSADSDFAHALDHSVGIEPKANETNLVGLYNQAYDAADKDTRNFLNLPADQAESLRQTRVYEPSYQAILQWGGVVNGGAPAPSAQKTISINV